MVFGIVSLLGLVGGLALILVVGTGVFYFFRAILPPYERDGPDVPNRRENR